ncbi:hypothetical protein [Photorhabdus namnaonensis]|nr:hypothetical protein [Photorhabdus namnaonensis]
MLGKIHNLTLCWFTTVGLLQLAECVKAGLTEGADQHDLARLSC